MITLHRCDELTLRSGGHLRRWSLPLLYGLDSLGSRQAWKAHYKMQMWKRMNRRKLWKPLHSELNHFKAGGSRWYGYKQSQDLKNYNPAHIKYTHHLCIYLKQCFHRMLTLRLKNLLSGAENVTGYWLMHSLCFCPPSVPESGTLARDELTCEALSSLIGDLISKEKIRVTKYGSLNVELNWHDS